MSTGVEAISTDAVAAAVARGLHRRFGELRHAVKLVVAMTGADIRSARNWFEAKTPPHDAALVRLMRDVDEVAEEILRLAGRHDAAEAARLRAVVSDMERALGRLGGAA